MSKLSQERLEQIIATVLKYAKETKPRGFTETVELQIGIKNYDPSRDKRFAGSVVLPHATKKKISVCVIADQKHVYECQEKGLEFIDLEGLKKFNKQKKPIKAWADKYDQFLASDSLIRQIPRVLGPQLNKMNKFPAPISHDQPIHDKINELQHTVKFQLKKVLCLGTAVGHVELKPDELQANLTLSINLLISLLKKGWQNVASLHVKSTMGPVQRLY